jgi:hypothetical protein
MSTFQLNFMYFINRMVNFISYTYVLQFIHVFYIAEKNFNVSIDDKRLYKILFIVIFIYYVCTCSL